MSLVQDKKWMQRALDLAEKGRDQVSPNPMVGACVVKAGKLVGEGVHRAYGKAHAEVNALKQAGTKAKGATLYVTLEPCSSWGKTPPCAEAIIKSGIKEVVIAARESNPKNKAGMKHLKKAKIKVRTGVLAREAKKQNEAFFKFITTGMPFVTLKMAQSLDGKIATVEGKSRWITSAASRNFVHKLRFEQDAIMVGKNTSQLDNPLLNPRLNKKKVEFGKPWRVVIDPKLEMPARARVFQGDQVTLLAAARSLLSKKGASKGRGKRVILPVNDVKGHLDLKDLLRRLGQLKVAKLLVEGGGETAWSLLNAGLVDKAVWMVAPTLIGGRKAKTSVEGEGIRNLEKVFRFKDLQVKSLGQDWIFEGRL